MKKSKNFKRFLGLALAFAMLVTVSSTSVFAAETTNTSTDVASTETSNTSVATPESARMQVSTSYVYYDLDEWNLLRTLKVETGNGYESAGGAVFVYLYNPSGELISGDWVMGLNDSASWTVWNLPAGRYTVKLVVQAEEGHTYINVTF